MKTKRQLERDAAIKVQSLDELPQPEEIAPGTSIRLEHNCYEWHVGEDDRPGHNHSHWLVERVEVDEDSDHPVGHVYVKHLRVIWRESEMEHCYGSETIGYFLVPDAIWEEALSTLSD